MVFKRLLGALGVGGPSVDTVLDGPVQPGGTLTGRVLVQGGSSDVDIKQITLDLVARVENEHHDQETEGVVVFHRATVAGAFRLAEGQQHAVPFSLPVPWETPVTELYGQPLGIVMGVRTELEVAGAVDKGDLDPLLVRPLPVQEAVLEAFGRLGFGFRSADLELGRIRGTGQTLPFYQEIELSPSPSYASALNQVEVTFLTTPSGVEVILEGDKRGFLFSGGGDALSRHTLSHADAGRADFTGLVDAWVRELAGRRGAQGGATHGHHGHHGRGGIGVGGVVAGAAAGIVGGMVMGEVIDEIGDAFEGEE